MVQALVPGAEAARDQRGDKAFLAMLLPVALLTLPWVTVLGYRIPWGYEPGGFLIWAVAGLGLLIYTTRQVMRGLRT